MSAPTEQEIRAFVGKKSGYYLSKWSALLSSEGHEAGFNVAGFWLPGLWLPYRKMYKATLIFYGIIITESILERIFFKEPPAGLGIIVSIAGAMICGVCGNRWYYSHTYNKIGKLRRLNLSGESLSQALRRCGGTRLVTAIGFLMMFLIIEILTSSAISVLLGIG